MELKADHGEQKPLSVLQGDGFCISRILARESSVGQSSRIFYRAAEGVPFKWEMQPGTPKDPQQEETIPPVCPSPLMQSLGLPLPNVDQDEPKESALKMSRIWNLRKIVKKSIGSDISKKVEILIGRNKKQESSRFGDSSFSSNSSSSSSSSNSHVLGTFTMDGPFCCSPWNVPAILDEGNIRIYYCRQHKTAFAVEEDGSCLTRVLSRVSTTEHFSAPLQNEGVPFRWEMQPEKPKTPPENEFIPPPSPPLALQSLALPRLRLHDGGEKDKDSRWERAWFWIRHRNKEKVTGKMEHEMSFRYHEDMKIWFSDEEFDASFRESVSVSSLSSLSPLSKGGWRVSKIKKNFQGGYFSCGPWSRRDIVVFARRKLKSFTC